jgi:hypothetical protein
MVWVIHTGTHPIANTIGSKSTLKSGWDKVQLPDPLTAPLAVTENEGSSVRVPDLRPWTQLKFRSRTNVPPLGATLMVTDGEIDPEQVALKRGATVALADDEPFPARTASGFVDATLAPLAPAPPTGVLLEPEPVCVAVIERFNDSKMSPSEAGTVESTLPLIAVTVP